MGKRLEDSRSLVVSAESYPLNLSAQRTKLKLKKFTKPEEQSARQAPGNTKATMRAELGPSGRTQSFVTCAEKEEKKMTHLKLTTFYPQAPEIQQDFFQLIEAVIDGGATNP